MFVRLLAKTLLILAGLAGCQFGKYEEFEVPAEDAQGMSVSDGGAADSVMSEIDAAGEDIIDGLDWVDAISLAVLDPHRIAARAIGYLSMRSDEGNSRCTAWLVALDLVITNYHCIRKPGRLENARLNFRYLYPEDYDNRDQLRDDGFPCTHLLLGDSDHDLALLQCGRHPRTGKLPAEQVGSVLHIDARAPRRGEAIYLLHQNCFYEEGIEHCTFDDAPPGEATKKVSLGRATALERGGYSIDDGFVNIPADSAIRHTADSLGGTSGGPVLSAEHRVVALHHAGSGTHNRAVRFDRIVAANPELVQLIGFPYSHTYAEGDIVRTAEEAEHYILKRSAGRLLKLHIPSEEVYFALNYHWDDALIVGSNQLPRFADGPALGGEDSWLRTADRVLWVIRNQQRYPFIGPWNDALIEQQTGWPADAFFDKPTEALLALYPPAPLPNGIWPPVAPARAGRPAGGSEVGAGLVEFSIEPAEGAHRYGLEICLRDNSTCIHDGSGAWPLIELPVGRRVFEANLAPGSYHWRTAALGDDGRAVNVRWVRGEWTSFSVVGAGCPDACNGNGACDARSGECDCEGPFDGEACDQCASGFVGYPDCREADQCNCNDADGDGFYPRGCNDANCARRTDCDDNNRNAHPGAAEECGNMVDEDCSGADLACAPPQCNCNDADGDGFYPRGCNDADCARRTDCDDNNRNAHPEAREVCGNMVDEDCSGADLVCPVQNATRFSVHNANPAPDEVICLSVMRPALGPMVTRREGDAHFLDLQVGANVAVEYVFYVSGGGDCNQWRRDLWPTGFEFRVGGVAVNHCAARTNSPDPDWNSMVVSIGADGRVTDAGDPNRGCSYVAAREGFGTRVSVLDLRLAAGETACASITQPHRGSMPMRFVAPNRFIADFAIRTPANIEFTVYRGRADCSWVGDVWPTANRIQVNDTDIMRCVPRAGQPAWRSMLAQLGNPVLDGGNLVCPIAGAGCTPFAVRLTPAAGRRLADRIEWWPQAGDAQRVAVPPDGGVLFAPYGSCSATVDEIQGLDRDRSRSFGSIFNDAPLCDLQAGGFGAAHDGACAR